MLSDTSKNQKMIFSDRKNLRSYASSLCIIFALFLDLNIGFIYPLLICFLIFAYHSSIVIERNGFTGIFFISWMMASLSALSYSSFSSLLFIYLLLILRSTENLTLNLKILGAFLYLQIGFVVAQIFFPESIRFLISLVSDGRVNILDYSDQPLAALRVTGLFTNPNMAALSILINYLLLIRQSKYTNFVTHLLVLCCVFAFGSRAGFLSFAIISFMFMFYAKGIRLSVLFMAIVFIWSIAFAKLPLDFRVFDLYNLLTLKGRSSQLRIDGIIQYTSYLENSGNFFLINFGHGYLDLQHFFFDGDVGNMLYMFGVLGTCITLTFISLKLLRSGHFSMLCYISPFLMGGGIFGNQKFAFIFILLTLVQSHQTKKRNKNEF